MTHVLSLLRSLARQRRALRGCLGLALAVVGWGCADKVVGPSLTIPKGQIGVYADVGGSGVTTLVIQVSGPGIVKPDNSADTLVFNIPLTNGVASGSLAVPAGPNRVITARAFAGVTETHRGSVTTNVLEGTNPTLSITLVPLVGTLPITVSIGSTIVVVRPLVASIAVGDTVRLTSEIRDYNGTILNDKVRWATLNPGKATVDTNGLVSVKDTGVVQIVGTYGTVGGAAKITGVAVPTVPSAIHLTWNGSVNTSWTEPNNWTPHGLGAARAPTLTDSVVVPAGAPRYPVLPCVDANAVRDIVIEAGAQINPSSCYPLNIYGSAVVAGPIPYVYVRPNAKLSGAFGDIYIKGAGVSLGGDVTANFVSVDIPTGTFSLNHHKLTTTSDFNVSGTGATVTMADGDTLIIGGNANWQGGDHNGLLTGGAVIARGNQFYGYRYFGTGTNRLVLDRAATGATLLGGFDYVNSPTNSQVRRLEIKSRDGMTVCGHIRVTDTLSIVSTATPSTIGRCSSYQVRVDGPMITGVNTDVAAYLMDLRHSTGTSLIGGTWHPDYTDFNTVGESIKPTLAYGNLRFFANNVLPANMSITGFLYLQGAGIELDFAGHKLQVANYVEVQDGATLKMTNAADSLLIGEYLYIPDDVHGTVKPKLSAGVITIGAYLEGLGFASSGTKVVMTGSSASTSKYINSMNSDTRPTQEMYDLEIATGANYGLCAKVKVAHDLTIRSGAHLGNWCGSPAIVLQNDLITEATSSFDASFVIFNSAIGTSHVLGTYAAGESQFTVANTVVKPGLAYGNVRVFAPLQLSGTTAVSGWLDINGAGANLTVNGNTLTIGDYLYLENSGTLTMNNASDAVTVAQYANFTNDNSTVHATTLTAGTLTIGAQLEGNGFSASGTHKVVMSGTSASTSKYINSMTYSSRPAQGFQNLEIAAGATYGLCSAVAVHGTLTVRSGATLQQWCGSPAIRTDGNFVTEPTSTITGNITVSLNSAFGTDNVAGTFTPQLTQINSSSVVGHLNGALGYKDMQFLAPISLNANMTVNGNLSIDGPAAILTLNGKQLTVTGTFDLNTNATVVMNNALDAIDIGGAAFWDSGASEAGKLTAGTVTFRGPTFSATNYETSGTHKTVFDRAGSKVRINSVGGGGTTQPMWNVDVKGAGISAECNLNVVNDLHVFTGATVDETCGSGTVWVGHTLTTDAGSAVTNGPSYPSSTKLAVVFEDPSGTQNVSGAYSADQTYFTALNSYIKPTLSGNGIDYKYMRIDQSTVFQDSTEIDGQLDVIGGIVSLNGKRVVVGGTLNLDPPGRIQMTSASDTLVVGINDPTADIFWDGADNSTDGTNPILTAGAIKFFGDRFYGPQYKATVSGSSHHRFIFMSPATGTVSVEGAPQFANMEIRTPRPLVNNGATHVLDSLIMGASTTYGGTSTLEIEGDLVTGASSDINLTTTVYVDGPRGTSLVGGRFRPTTTYFRNASPNAGAIKAGLEYQNVGIQQGQYALTTGGTTTTMTGNLDIDTGGRITVNGQTLNVGGALSFGSSGGGFVMSNIADAVNVTGTFQGNSGQVGSQLSAGTLTVSGNYNMFTDVAASGIHKVVMAGSAAKTISSLNGSARALQGLDITGTGNVSFSSGLVINGNLQILSAVAVTGSSSTINGNISSVAGSSFTHSNLSLDGSSGTSSMNGTLSITGTMTFLSGTQTIKTGAGYSYANMTVTSAATVTGGSLSVPGTLTIGSGGSLTVPTGSSLATVNVSGSLTFAGTSLSTQTLTVLSGGTAFASDLTASNWVDFGRIAYNAGSTLDNNSSRSTGPTQGGFRYKSTGSPSGLGTGGTLVGPAPASQP